MVFMILALGGCTTTDRNRVAFSLCDRTPGCTTSRDEPTAGPEHQREVERVLRPGPVVRGD
ncbi:hypothetical protein COC42_05290 [Sphingomonas spermidinifaciens]|uniref:Uncharacterized protein n=1 Tax=Sphingomonas spermidinifaciens TaxID=1141889 RepID=A0A2A4B5P3_9SPHN|nr:hypothetical protein COC42_05290 [Sphingomonas spermidinifaciens]